MNRLFVTIHIPDRFTDEEARALSNNIHTAVKSAIGLAEKNKQGIMYYGQLRKVNGNRKIDVEWNDTQVPTAKETT